MTKSEVCHFQAFSPFVSPLFGRSMSSSVRERLATTSFHSSLKWRPSGRSASSDPAGDEPRRFPPRSSSVAAKAISPHLSLLHSPGSICQVPEARDVGRVRELMGGQHYVSIRAVVARAIVVVDTR
ncbi:hypothetical protein [Streptomyces flaveolus]|uniref:hypothetical protein n=1 Tax=Streptomyces flaveolus TaxID=67297 RepID=UPI0016700968|nr:hypothetical protein [Streptomyces flaveolus]